jgi:phosphate starvation-inducible membrane PsiE
MKAYLIVSGAIFGIVGVAHVVRLFIEDHSSSDRWFITHNVALFIVGGGLALWALRLLLRGREPSA